MSRGRAWLWLVLFAVLVVAAKLILRLPLKMPGHAGLVGMALLVAARAIVPMPVAATVVSALAAVLTLALGAGDKGVVDTMTNFLASGVAVDAVAFFWPSGALAFALQGLAGNVAKVVAKLLLESLADIPTGFALLNQAYPLLLHAVFGLAGGYLAFWIVRRSARGRPLSV